MPFYSNPSSPSSASFTFSRIGSDSSSISSNTRSGLSGKDHVLNRFGLEQDQSDWAKIVKQEKQDAEARHQRMEEYASLTSFRRVGVDDPTALIQFMLWLNHLSAGELKRAGKHNA